MKKIYLAVASLCALVLLATSCKLEPKVFTVTPIQEPAKSPKDVEVTYNGVMNVMGDYVFLGRNVLALADMCSDIAVANPATGHFVSLNTWTFQDTDGYLSDIYSSGFIIVHNATMGIMEATRLLKETEDKLNKETDEAVKQNLSQDKEELETLLSRLYGAKAFAYFYLSNIFAKCYSSEHLNDLGLVLVPNDAIIPPKTNITRATVEETWKYILDLVAKAESYPNADASRFEINPFAIKALEARIHLYMGNWSEAVRVTEELIAAGIAPIDNPAAYLEMWTKLSQTPEDIFTIAKSENNNLSANALNTLYGSYKASLNKDIVPLFGENDYRKNLVLTENTSYTKPHPAKYDGTETSQAVSNVRIIRASEIYLIAAEAYAQMGNLDLARERLLTVAKRNADITDVATLPQDKEALLKFISEERIREFFCEGQRFYDLRRTGETANVGVDPNYRPYRFVFPIPDNVIKAGYMTQQNEDWLENIPGK